MRTLRVTLFSLALLGLLVGTGCYYERIESRDRVEDHRGGPDHDGHHEHHDHGPDRGPDHGPGRH